MPNLGLRLLKLGIDSVGLDADGQKSPKANSFERIPAAFHGRWEARFDDGSCGTGLWTIGASEIRYEDPTVRSSFVSGLRQIPGGGLQLRLQVGTRRGERRYDITLRLLADGSLGGLQRMDGAATATQFWMVKTLDGPQALIDAAFHGIWEPHFDNGDMGTGTWTITSNEVRYDDPTVQTAAVREMRTSSDRLSFRLNIASSGVKVYDITLSPLSDGSLEGQQIVDGETLLFQMFKRVSIAPSFHGVWECVFENGDLGLGTWTMSAHEIRYDDPTVEAAMIRGLCASADVLVFHLHVAGSKGGCSYGLTIRPASDGTLHGQQTSAGKTVAFRMLRKVPIAAQFHGLWEVHFDDGELGSGTWTIDADEIRYEDTTVEIAMVSQRQMKASVLSFSLHVALGSNQSQVYEITLRATADGSLDGVQTAAGEATKFRMLKKPPIGALFHGEWKVHFDNGDTGTGTWTIDSGQIKYDDPNGQPATISHRRSSSDLLSFQLHVVGCRYDIVLGRGAKGDLDGQQSVDGSPEFEKFRLTRSSRQQFLNPAKLAL